MLVAHTYRLLQPQLSTTYTLLVGRERNILSVHRAVDEAGTAVLGPYPFASPFRTEYRAAPLSSYSLKRRIVKLLAKCSKLSN